MALVAMMAVAVQTVLVVACAPEATTAPTMGAEGATPAGGATMEGATTEATSADGGETVQVLGIWGGGELSSFRDMVKPWEDDTGNRVEFTGTRDITADLTVRTEGNNPPDVAIPAEVGLFKEYATSGQLTPLSACDGLDQMIQDAYPPSFVDLGTVDGTLYGFFMKADTKATIWYNPTFFTENSYEALTAQSSWDDLVALSDQIKADGTPPWSMGLESGGASGWPASDWIQQVLLNQAGAEVYDGVVDGSVKYTDPAVKSAWEAFGDVALTDGYTSQGSVEGILATNFQDAAFPPFMSPPEAAMTYLGGFAQGFITDQFPDAVAGTDYDFMPFPGGAVTGGANIAYAFDASPATCSFLTYLASADAQKIWVDQGGFTSVNSNVDTSAYPDAVSQRLAEQLLTAETFRFDLDDAIGGAFQQAIFEGTTQYLQSPDQLDTILENIESSRSADMAQP
jgi:alpha-glucoside transport system substrate-binding protein